MGYGNVGDDYVGDDVGDDNMIGAVARALAVRGRRRRRISPPQVPQQPLQGTDKLRSFLGAGVAVWTAADATDKQLLVEPQETFEGKRFILDVREVGGVSAGLVVVRRIDIGTQPQSPSVEQPAPAVMFRADATYANLDLQLAFRANKIIVTMGITAVPGAGVTVTAVGGFYGNWIR